MYPMFTESQISSFKIFLLTGVGLYLICQLYYRIYQKPYAGGFYTGRVFGKFERFPYQTKRRLDEDIENLQPHIVEAYLELNLHHYVLADY
jgi:hypothetical protein